MRTVKKGGIYAFKGLHKSDIMVYIVSWRGGCETKDVRNSQFCGNPHHCYR